MSNTIQTPEAKHDVQDAQAPTTPEQAIQQERPDYEPPAMESSSIFHTVSNGPPPQFSGGYG